MVKFKIFNVEFEISFLFVFVLNCILNFNNENLALSWFAFVLLHELCHLFFMIIFKNFPKKIKMQFFGITITQNKPTSHLKTLIILISGSFGNLLAAFFCLLLNFKIGIIANLSLAFFNFLPNENLDGGQILEIIMFKIFKVKTSYQILNICSNISNVIIVMLIGCWFLFKVM